MKWSLILLISVLCFSCARTGHLTKEKNLMEQDCEYMRNTAIERGYEYDC